MRIAIEGPELKDFDLTEAFGLWRTKHYLK